MKIFEPMLIGTISHAIEVASTWEYEDEDLDLAALEAILIYMVEFWRGLVPLPGAGTTAGSHAILSLDPDVTFELYEDAIKSRDTIAYRYITEATTGAQAAYSKVEMGARIWDLKEPVLAVNDLRGIFYCSLVPAGPAEDFVIRYHFKRVQLTEAEMVPIIARRR